MRESIVCTGQIGTKAYCFPETGIEIFSYEELCYYLSRNMICYLYTLPEENLLYYIRDELGMERLYRQLSKLTNPDKDQMKYFSALFREGHYFSEEELREILDEYRRLKNTPYCYQCKWLGDLFLRSNRASMALLYYEEALKRKEFSEVEEGNVYHNMGVAWGKLFRFQDAKIDFLKAYQYNGDEESLFYYYCIIGFTQNLEKAGEELKSFEVSDILLESFENRFAGLTEDFQGTDGAAKFRKIAFLENHERKEEAQENKLRFIRQMQREFRRELDVDEKMVVTNLPISYSIDNEKD